MKLNTLWSTLARPADQQRQRSKDKSIVTVIGTWVILTLAGTGLMALATFNTADTALADTAAQRLQPHHLTYQGAFRLPDQFNWGALGLTCDSGGDAGAGSLLVTGFETISSSEHPFESCWNPEWNCYAWYGQVRIPTPAIEANWENLPQATLSGSPINFDQGLISTVHREYVFVSDIEWVPRTGSQTQDKLYGAADFWYAEGVFGENSFPTIWMTNPNGTQARGMFHVGPNAAPFHGRKTGSYLFSAPQWYARQYLGGRTLITGRSRGTPADQEPITTHGGSQGPTLLAFHPFDSDNPTGNLDALPFLYYRVKFPGCAGPNIGPTADCDYPGFTMCDNWTGGAFVDDGQRQAILLLGYKGLGENCYGSTACGDPCSDGQGYHCHPYERQVIFYDVHELGAVAGKTRDPWTVLPYTIWRPSEFYLQGDTCWNVGGMTFDPASGRLFMVERGLGDGETNAAVVHVWKIQGLTEQRMAELIFSEAERLHPDWFYPTGLPLERSDEFDHVMYYRYYAAKNIYLLTYNGVVYYFLKRYQPWYTVEQWLKYLGHL